MSKNTLRAGFILLLAVLASAARSQSGPMCPLPGSPCNPGGGASQPNVNGATGAGNPIDVVSGNKYTFATDVDWEGDLAIAFHRHYNSSAGISAELGLGWTHGFGLTLRRAQRGAAPATIRVHQGDGRDIEFVAQGAPREGVQQYVSRPAGYGVLEESTAAIDQLRKSARKQPDSLASNPGSLRPWTWRWLDGKRVEFDGLGLARKLSRNGDALDFGYDAQRRLVRVRDANGRELALAYWDDAAERLARFGANGKPAAGAARGRLKSVTLPGGEGITYGYDAAALLTEVRYPDGTSARYEYENAGGQPRLARVFARDGRIEAQYTYDAAGRAVSTQAGDGRHRIDVEYRLAASPRVPNETWLRNGRGDISVYRWRTTATGPQMIEALGPGCAACAPTNERYGYDALGRLNRVEKLSETDPLSGRAPRVLEAVVTTHDDYGRVLETSLTRDAKTQLVERRRYAAGFAPGPEIIERPSIAPGHWQTLAIRYDARGLPDRIVESGQSPRIAGGRTQYTAISRATTFGYTPAGRLAWVDGPESGAADRVAFDYESNGLLIAVRYPEGVSETFGYDTLGRLNARQAEDGVHWAYRYAAGSARYLTTPQPFVVAKSTLVSLFSFAPTGALAGYRTPQGERFALTRDAAGLLTRVSDDRGFAVDFAYDAEGNQLGEDWRARSDSRVARRTVRFDYDAYRRVSGYSAHPSEQLRFGYDDTGTLHAVDDPAAAQLRVIAQSDGRIQELVRETANGAQRLGSFALAAGTTLDAARLPRSTREDEDVEQRDHAGTRLAAFARHALAHDWTALWPAHAARFEAFEGPNGDAHGVVYDDFGRVVHAFSSDAGADEYVYGAGPEPLSYCRENGTCEKTEYDSLGRPRRVTLSGAGAASVMSFEYAGSLLVKLDNELQTTRWRYDAAGRLVERTDTLPVGEYRHAWQFDARGRLIAHRLPDGSSLVPKYENAGGKPVALDLVDADGRTRPLLTDIRHNAIESFTGFRYGNGVSKRMSFDDHGRLIAEDIGASVQTDGALLAGVIPVARGAGAARHLWSSDLSFDTNGRLDGVTRDGQRAPVRIDDDGRLLEIGARNKETFAYDAGGNLVQRSMGDARRTFAYESASNRLARVDETAVEHDPSGNVTRLGNLRIAYGADNRPRKVDRDDGASVSYAYNALGERVRRTVGAGDSWFLYGDQRLESEVDDAGRVTGQYIFLGDEPIARIEHQPRGFFARHSPNWLVRAFADAPSLVFIHADPLGTPRHATNEAGDVVWSATYDAYGAARVSTAAKVRIDLRFAGQWYDDVTGLHYNYLRDYSPTAARYLQPDPAGLAGGFNLYEYVGGNPLAAVDTQGTSIVSWLAKRTGMQIVQREIRDYIQRFVRTRVGQIVQRWARRGSNLADQFGEVDEILDILNAADGIGVWDVVGLIPVIGDAVDIGRSAVQLCRIKALLKRLDRKLMGFDRLPVSGGSWASGRAGQGVFRMTDGREIPFRDGFPDFSGLARRLPNGRNSVTISLGRDSASDIAEANRQMRALDRNWVQPPNTTWHHDTNCGVMMLVDVAVNNIAHTGGRALHDAGLCP